MIQIFIAVVTVSILALFGKALSSVWDAGYWYILVPLPVLIIWMTSRMDPPEVRGHVKDDLKTWLPWRN